MKTYFSIFFFFLKKRSSEKQTDCFLLRFPFFLLIILMNDKHNISIYKTRLDQLQNLKSYLLRQASPAVLDSLLAVSSRQQHNWVKLRVVQLVNSVRRHVEQGVQPTIHYVANSGQTDYARLAVLAARGCHVLL